jgi:hypothetical protein
VRSAGIGVCSELRNDSRRRRTNLWREFTKKRDDIDRFVVNGLAFAAVGVGMGVLSLVFNGSTFFMRSLAVSFVVVGLCTAGVASVVIAYRKSASADQ